MKKRKKVRIPLNDKRILIIGIILVLLLMIGVIITFLTQKNINHYTIEGNGPIKGIDVSNHQGEIKWGEIPHDTINFVFIKATEGLSYQDPFFEKNWKGSSERNFLKGAYHFFKTGASGESQADNFIAMVPKETNTLPPVLDLEIVEGNKEAVIKEIKIFLDKVEQYYQQKPILYVNRATLETYVKGHFDDYLIWFADYADEPYYGKEVWTFWQYTEKGLLDGINGYVDFNWFDGSKDDLIKLTQ